MTTRRSPQPEAHKPVSAMAVCILHGFTLGEIGYLANAGVLQPADSLQSVRPAGDRLYIAESVDVLAAHYKPATRRRGPATDRNPWPPRCPRDLDDTDARWRAQ